ncbi:MAG: hypothetical protein AAF281_09355, partial [Pseudomonadota bacterium]
MSVRTGRARRVRVAWRVAAVSVAAMCISGFAPVSAERTGAVAPETALHVFDQIDAMRRSERRLSASAQSVFNTAPPVMLRAPGAPMRAGEP